MSNWKGAVFTELKLTYFRRIHKPKYDEDEDDDKPSVNKSPKSIKSTRGRSKSKSRHFLGLNKTRSNTTTSS